MMKKIFTILSAFCAIVALAACQSTTDSKEKTGTSQVESTTSAELTASLAIQFQEAPVSHQVSFKEGATVLDILEQNHEVTLEDGMVTAIDGVSQDAANNTYWMYDINGKLAPKGVTEMMVSDGDQIDFYLETFD